MEEDKESVLAEISKHQQKFDEAMEISKNKNGLLKEISSHEKDLETQKKDLESLEGNITSKNKKLDSVNRLIKEKDDVPISLSAGMYYVGSDIPSGRYKVVPVGRGSNFFVQDENDRSIVNTILGPDREMEYIFSVGDGGTIDTRSTVKLISIE